MSHTPDYTMFHTPDTTVSHTSDTTVSFTPVNTVTNVLDTIVSCSLEATMSVQYTNSSHWKYQSIYIFPTVYPVIQ